MSPSPFRSVTRPGPPPIGAGRRGRAAPPHRLPAWRLAAVLGAAMWIAGAPAATGAEKDAVGGFDKPATRSTAPGALEDHPVRGVMSVRTPAGDIRSVAMLLGDGTRRAALEPVAARLAELNTLVVEIDANAWMAALAPDAGSCVDLAASLGALAHDLEERAGVEGYIPPMIVGRDEGATLAYAALLQGTGGDFKGAVSLGFCPELRASAALCPAGALGTRTSTGGTGVALDAVSQVPAPWSVVHGGADPGCDAGAAPAFVARVEGATLVEVPGADAGYAPDGTLMPAFEQAYLALAGSDADLRDPPEGLPPGLSDLPLTTVVDAAAMRAAPAGALGDTFAIMLSGDGGWADLDAGVARRLAAAGIPVVGVSSLKYLWRERPPEQLAKDYARIGAAFAKLWKRPRVMLVGYSLGADVAPFMVSHATADERRSIALLALLSPGREASFQFHLSDWLKSADGGTPIGPEMAKLGTVPVLCLYGEAEGNLSLCTTGAVTKEATRSFPGGHHLNDDYDGIVSRLLDALRAPPATRP